MAKWGEGDPRWIVEERADATNVNNWHWTERDASTWSKDRLKELFMQVKVEDDIGECEVTEVSTLTGEATANNRKGKLIFFYEWDVKLEWKGIMKDGSSDVKGKVHIPNLSDENGADDIDINVTMKKETKETRLLKDLMRSKGAALIRDQLQQYIDGLKKEFSQGMILPPKDKTDSPVTPVNKVKSPPDNKDVKPVPSAQKDLTAAQNMKNLSLGVKLETQKLVIKEEFKCSVDDLFETFTDPQRVRAFTRSDAQMEVEIGGKFTLFNGNVSGEFVSLDRGKQIIQRWRYKSWPDAHFSTVTMDFTQKPDCTELKLTQTGVPKSDYERTKEGWKNYYWRGINMTFGFGARLF
ncbi:activator of 90 kDa heat shock protein ATPase homolog 1-like [Amphiura filiformis]|uniref:activator of 90 kDa heat shock protein ATPase homolog 1-like n=1 Tax=Amphiura filiformis TaxID=82378 RepID=UPI003B2163AD